MRQPPPAHLTFAALLLLSASRSACGGPANITVDNATPNPTTGAAFSYAPANAWHEGNGCGLCSSKPNASLAYNQTWQDVTFDPSTEDTPENHEVQTATMQFNGTAIYIYGIILPAADYSFFIDGEKTGSYTFLPAVLARDYTYNVLLYHNASIPSGSHTFIMQNGGTVDVASLGLLDYAIYTTEMDDGQGTSPSQVTASSLGQPGTDVSASPTGSSPASTSNTSLSGNIASSKSNTSTSVIVAAVVPSFVAVAILTAVFIYWGRHRRRWGIQKIPPRTEYASQTGGRPIMQVPLMSGNEALRPYMVDRDQGSIPPQKGYINDANMQATNIPIIPAMSSPTMQALATPPTSGSTLEAISERDGTAINAPPLRAHIAPSEVSSSGGPPSWIPGSEPPPAYDA